MERIKRIFKKTKEVTEEQMLQEIELGYVYSLELDSLERMMQQNDIDYALNFIDLDTFEFKKNQLFNQLNYLKEKYVNQLTLIYE